MDPPFCVGGHLLGGAPPCERPASLYSRGLAPVQVMLSWPIITYRPHPPHSQAQRNFIALRLICAAFAVRERLGDPRVVPRFTCSILPSMSTSTSPGSRSLQTSS